MATLAIFDLQKQATHLLCNGVIDAPPNTRATHISTDNFLFSRNMSEYVCPEFSRSGQYNACSGRSSMVHTPNFLYSGVCCNFDINLSLGLVLNLLLGGIIK